jgi:hypothetical protein
MFAIKKANTTAMITAGAVNIQISLARQNIPLYLSKFIRRGKDPWGFVQVCHNGR